MSIQFPQLPTDALLRINRYVKKLDGREITPVQSGNGPTELTEEQILLRKIARIVGQHMQFPSSLGTVNAGMMTLQSVTSSAPVAPMTPSEIEENHRMLELAHRNKMVMLTSVMKQLEVLRTDPNFYDELLAHNQNQSS